MVAVLFWVAIAVLGFVVEMHTNAFIGVFVGLAAAFAFVVALSGFGFAVQAIVWLAVSALAIGAIRPLALRRFRNRHPELDMSRPTDTSMNDLRGVVEVAVGDVDPPGKVRIQGESWRAVTDWPSELPDGTPVVVKKAYGTTLWVDPT